MPLSGARHRIWPHTPTPPDQSPRPRKLYCVFSNIASAKTKLLQGSWQHPRVHANLSAREALSIASGWLLLRARVIVWSSDASGIWTIREGSLDEKNDSDELEFWQKASSTARFAAAWQLVKQAYALKGKHGELNVCAIHQVNAPPCHLRNASEAVY